MFLLFNSLKSLKIKRKKLSKFLWAHYIKRKIQEDTHQTVLWVTGKCRADGYLQFGKRDKTEKGDKEEDYSYKFM